jgi:hypothetical protein
MASTLGGRNGLYVSVINTGTTTIQKGRACQLEPAATLTRRGDEYIVPVEPVITTTGAGFFGVATDPIPAGQIGTVCIHGACIVETDDSVTAGTRMSILLTSGNEGKFKLDAAGVHGKAINTDETEWVAPDFGATTKKYALAVVNFGHDGFFA